MAIQFQSALLTCIVSLICFFSLKCDCASYEDDLSITLEQKAILDEFRNIMISRGVPKDYMLEEAYLIRWLRVKYFNIVEAEKMLASHIKWFKDERMDTIQQEDFSDMEENRYWTEGRDKEGRPILYIHVGLWDLRKQVITGNQERFLRYVNRGLDEICQTVRDLGERYRNVSQAILLLNADGFSLAKHGCLQCVPLILRVIYNYESHFPGYAEKLLAINVPAAAEFIVTAARGALHPDTNKVLQVYGINPRSWKPVVERFIDWNQLPTEIGGSKIYSGDEFDY